MASKPSERFVWAGDTLALDPADRVLEVGCGHGVAARRNREHIAGGRAVLRTAALETADLGNERFDKVFTFNVAHLLAVAAGGPGIVGRHLAPDGAVYLFWDARHAQPGGARDLADRLSERLRLAEFSVDRVPVKHLRPVPAVCVIGRP